MKKLLVLALALAFCGSAQALQVAGQLYVDLDAAALTPGVLPSWSNAGTLGGQFNQVGDPTVTTVGGMKAVEFDGNDGMNGTIVSPVNITANNSYEARP